MNWRILLKNCEASLGELNPLEGLKVLQEKFTVDLSVTTDS